MTPTSLHFCTSDSWGGLELYACTLMAELKKAGCEVFAICKSKSKVESFLIVKHIGYTHLPSYATVSLASVRFIKSLIFRQDIQVLHVHFHKDVWPASLALLGDKERKLFLSIYMGVPRKNDIFHRLIYSRVDALFTSSEELNKRLPSLYPVPRSKIHFLPYGRSLENYRRDEAKRLEIRSKYGVRPHDILVGTMTRIDPGKGVIDFARSFAYIDGSLREKTKFMIVGEPTRKGRVKTGESPYEPACEEYLRQLKKFISEEGFSEKISLTGFQDDLIGYLSAFDVLVFPSRDELYSLVVLDAMCMGLPVVAARSGGNVRQVTDGVNGLLYEVANSEDLAKKVELYLRRPTLRKQHAGKARQFVQDSHSMENTVRSLIEFYQN